MSSPTTQTDLATPEIVNEELAGLVKKGSAALQKGDLDDALASFEQVVQAFPDRPEGHNNLGALYTSLGHLDRAETCFDQVLGLLPGNANIHYNRGLVRARQEKFEAARLDFEAVLAQNPDDTDARNNLGVAAYLQGQNDEAKDHFTQALASNPEHTNALTNLCDLEAGGGRPDRGVTLCEEFLSRSDDHLIRRKLLELRSAVCIAGLDRACSEADAILAADPKDADARELLGSLIKARAALAEPAQD